MDRTRQFNRPNRAANSQRETGLSFSNARAPLHARSRRRYLLRLGCAASREKETLLAAVRRVGTNLDVPKMRRYLDVTPVVKPRSCLHD